MAPRRRFRLSRPWRIFLRRPSAVIATTIIVGMILVGLLAPYLTPYDPTAMKLVDKYAPPGPEHLLGADQLGRDVLARVMYGSRISLGIGVASTGLSMIAGAIIGVVAGFYGGAIDRYIMVVMDMLMAFPSMLLALVLVAALGSGGVNTAIALAVAFTPPFARLARASTLSVRQKEYVLAAQSLGQDSGHIMTRHILPNIVAPMMVTATLTLGVAILAEASLSYLGLGVPPPAPSWGAIVNDGKSAITHAPWISTAGGLAVAIAVIAVNMIGDVVRDAFDPRLKGTGQG